MKLPNVAIRRVVDDLQKAELGDLRRNRRLGRVASNLAKRPNASIPEIMGSEAELEGAYRLVNNPRVTMDALHEAHAKETAARASKVGRVLAIHDTTPASPCTQTLTSSAI